MQIVLQMDGFSKKSSLLLGKRSTVFSNVSIPVSAPLNAVTPSISSGVVQEKASSLFLHGFACTMGTKSPCEAEHGEPMLLCSQRQPDPARVPAVSWTVPMAHLIVALPAITGMGESLILKNKR